MIGSSRRRSAVGRQDSGSALELHIREARLANTHRRLLHASLAALVGSLAALLLGLALPGRLWVTLAAAVLGVAWPPRQNMQSVLASIRAQAGLSYETALGLQADAAASPEATDDSGERHADPYGFEAAVLQRAALSVRGYESEPRPAWWLPALVLTAALLALPELAFSLPGSNVAPSQPAPASAPGGTSQPEPTPEPAAPEPPDPARVEPLGAAHDESVDDGEAPVTDLPEGDAEGQAPLARYLQSLRERPAGSDGASGGASQGADTPDAERRLGTDDRDANESRSRRDGDPASSERTEGASDQDGGPAGGSEPERAEETQEDGEMDGEGSTEADEAEAAPQAVEPGGDQQESGQAGGRDEPGADGLQASGEGDAGSDAEGADSAGGGGSDAADDALDSEGAHGALERLQGVLRSGPETVAGSVRLPGSSDVELPPGTNYAPYQSAAEEAITEGDLPLDYQEIIRRYFR